MRYIFECEKPANLPAQARTKYQPAIHLKTAKAPGLTAPSSLLVRADEVIGIGAFRTWRSGLPMSVMEVPVRPHSSDANG
jgi:hypothetical protein